MDGERGLNGVEAAGKTLGIMSFEEYAAIEHPIPYTYRVAGAGKSIFYYGSRHTSDPDDVMFEDIVRALDTFGPELVLVEGARMLNSDRSRKTLDEIEALDVRVVIRKYGESMFTAREASLRGIKVESPEPELAGEIRYIIDRGFGENEAALYYMCSYLYHWFTMREKPDIDAFMRIGLEFLRRSYPWNETDFSVPAFMERHCTFLGTAVERYDAGYYLRLIDPVPWRSRGSDQTVLNEVARLSNRYRDAFVVSRIRDLLRTYDRLLIVFGATHACMQRPAIERILGPSRAT
jgi:hypothetical protein